jgi:hypothetical protein
MTSKRVSQIAAVLALSVMGSPSWAQNRQPPPGGPRGIPAAAYTACSGKAVGASVTDTNGVSGTCQTAPDGRLALRPSGPPPNGGGGPGPASSSETN